MMDFSRMFVVNGVAAGWTEVSKAVFILSVVGDYLKLILKAGRDPFAYEVNTALGRFLEEYEAEYGPVERYQRSHPYRFAFSQGMSGRQDTFIEIDNGDGYPTRHHLMHESCYGKASDMGGFVYDYLDLCVVGGFFEIKDGCYRYIREEDKAADAVEMKVVKPRLTEYEEGWTSPYGYPKDVVYLKVCREAPEPESDDEEAVDIEEGGE